MAIRDVADCSLIDLYPYIKGEAFTGKSDRDYMDERSIDVFCRMISESPSADMSLQLCENYKDFYNIEVDFKSQIPIRSREDCFYAAKNGCYSTQIPPFCHYMVKKAWDTYKIANLIPMVIPVPVLKEFFKDGYLRGGLCFKDVICNVAAADYEPFSESRYKSVMSGWTEIYIEQEDMVAAVPKSIGNSLDDETLKRVRKTEYGLAIENVLLRTMCGYTGGINSTYDLRTLI